jgi:hypothetical protein
MSLGRGAQLGAFEIVALLGAGGRGITFHWRLGMRDWD